MEIRNARARPSAIVATALALLLGGCAVPSLGIRLGPVQPTAQASVEINDLRPENRKHLWRDPRFGKMSQATYIGDGDTQPSRLAVFEARLAANPEFLRRFQGVEIETFDILWNTSATTAFIPTVELGAGKPKFGTLGGEGNNTFTCTLKASVSGRSHREAAKSSYFDDGTHPASHPLIGDAARRCLDDVIDRWMRAALGAGGA